MWIGVFSYILVDKTVYIQMRLSTSEVVTCNFIYIVFDLISLVIVCLFCRQLKDEKVSNPSLNVRPYKGHKSMSYYYEESSKPSRHPV